MHNKKLFQVVMAWFFMVFLGISAHAQIQMQAVGAAETGNLSELARVLSLSPATATEALNIPDEPVGTTLLHITCRYGHEESSRFLVEHYKADVNAQDENGNTPLMEAAGGEGDAQIVSLLASNGARLNEQYRSRISSGVFQGFRAAHFAALYGNHEALQALHYSGADMNATDDRGQTPLHVAILSMTDDPQKQPFYLPTIYVLVEDIKVHVSAETNRGGGFPNEEEWCLQPLCYALSQRNLEVIQLLVSSGADISAYLDKLLRQI